MAIKDGKSFFIEHKKIVKRRNGTFRMSGKINGDIIIASLPSGRIIFIVSKESCLSKTARLVEMID